MKEDELRPIINTIPMLPVNHSDPTVMILQLKKESKNKTLIGVPTQRAETEIRFLDLVRTWSTLENNKDVGREELKKEPMLAIDKPKPSPTITLSEEVYGS